MKQKIIFLYELLLLATKHPFAYMRFFIFKKHKILKLLKQNRIKKIRPVQLIQWKIWYGTCYFSGIIKDDNKDVSVFIKVMGKDLESCYNNELIVNDYILQTSLYLAEKTPKIYNHFSLDDTYIIVYENLKFQSFSKNEESIAEIGNVLSEYTEAGIIHTDFGLANMGLVDNKYYFFDYGTSICPLSEIIRIRRSDTYNVIDKAIPSALNLIPEPDYYYDDAAFLGIEYKERNNINFIIAKQELFFVKLGPDIFKFYEKDEHLYKMSEQ